MRTLILIEGTLLALVGGVVGWFLGIGWVWLAVWAAPRLTIEGDFGWRLFATAIGIALAMGLVGGLVPAWTASRLDPVESLRYE